MKIINKVSSLIIAAAIFLSIPVGLGIDVKASLNPAPIEPESVSVRVYETRGILDTNLLGKEIQDGKLRKGSNYDLVVTIYDSSFINSTNYISGKKPTVGNYTFDSDCEFGRGSAKADTRLTQDSGGDIRIDIIIRNVPYKATDSRRLYMTLTDVTYEGKTISYKIDAPIPSQYFSDYSGGSSGNSDPSTDYKSEIVIENIIVTDANGTQLDKVTKDTPRFNVSIVYAEYGTLREIDFDNLYDDDSLEVYLTNAGSFMPSGSNRGTIKKSVSSYTDAPRFRVEFKNLSWDGASNSIAFQVRYNINGESIKGEGSALVYQARPKEESSEDESIPPPTPYIIVNRYSYGENTIEAGNDFRLDLSFKNTSNEISLENIVMTVTTPDDMSIASASNTYYINSISAGGSMDYSLDLQVKPNASVGSHSIQIAFSYQYLSKKERKENKTTENIAIPIAQIDRFSVDPITEMPSGLVGEAAYLSVSFINRGKSTTYNITGFAKSNLEIIAPAEHYGNLDAGKSDSIDVSLVPQESGELYGEIIIQYEDENTNQKEISVPFTMYVDAPWTPPPYIPPDMNGIEPAQASNVPTIIFCVAGGLLMTVPIALYLMKRVKAKGSADLDEEF